MTEENKKDLSSLTPPLSGTLGEGIENILIPPLGGGIGTNGIGTGPKGDTV